MSIGERVLCRETSSVRGRGRGQGAVPQAVRQGLSSRRLLNRHSMETEVTWEDILGTGNRPCSGLHGTVWREECEMWRFPETLSFSPSVKKCISTSICFFFLWIFPLSESLLFNARINFSVWGYLSNFGWGFWGMCMQHFFPCSLDFIVFIYGFFITPCYSGGFSGGSRGKYIYSWPCFLSHFFTPLQTSPLSNVLKILHLWPHFTLFSLALWMSV